MFTKVYEADFSAKSLKDYSDRELSIFYYYAQELRCGKYIKAVNDEIKRRKVS